MYHNRVALTFTTTDVVTGVNGSLQVKNLMATIQKPKLFFQFHSCHWHGCIKCFPNPEQRTEVISIDKKGNEITRDDAYQRTLKHSALIRTMNSRRMPLRDRRCGFTSRFKSASVPLFQHDLVVCIYLSTRLGSSCLISELLASNSFVLKLDVFQLTDKLARIRTPYNLSCRGECQFEGEILVKRLWVEDTAACQNLVVKVDFVFLFVDRFQLVFCIHPRGRLVARIGTNLAQLRTMDSLHKHFVTLVNG